MGIHKNFPASPYEIPDTETRWFPEEGAIGGQSKDKLIPPLVKILRKKSKGFSRRWIC